MKSFFLTVLFSFSAPILLLSSLLTVVLFLTVLPGLTPLGDFLSNQIVNFLATFGNGDPVNGSLTIGLAWGFVGGLFDLCTTYRRIVF